MSAGRTHKLDEVLGEVRDRLKRGKPWVSQPEGIILCICSLGNIQSDICMSHNYQRGD